MHSDHFYSDNLTEEKQAPSLCFLLRQFVKIDTRELFRKKLLRFWNNTAPYVNASEYSLPESSACQKALALVQESSPDFLIGHCLRTHAFAIAMAHKVNCKVDREVLFMGCIMHDLGLTHIHDHNNTFEVDGARAARSLCIREGIDNRRANLVHEMVALHNSVGVADKREPEVRLVHYGAGADVIGLLLHDINPTTLEEILQTHPRDGFGEGMAQLIEDQINRKPDSYMSSMVKLGFLKKLRNTKLSGN
jgi:hypothetical protein